MFTEEKLLDSCTELLSEYRNILFKLKDQTSWKLRAIRFWLQYSFYEDIKKLESAVNAYPLPAHLEEIRNRRLESIRNFQKENEPKIFTLKINWKSGLLIFSIFTILLTWLINHQSMSENESNLLLGSIKNFFMLKKGDAALDLIHLLLSNPVVAILGIPNVSLILGSACSSFLDICQVDQHSRLIMRYPQDFIKSGSPDKFFNNESPERVKEKLSTQESSYLERQRFSAFKNLQSDPPSVFLRPEGWVNFFNGSLFLFICFSLILVGVVIGPEIFMYPKFLIFSAFSFFFFLIGSIVWFLKCYRSLKEVMEEEKALSRISIDETSEFAQSKEIDVILPEEIINDCQKLGLQGELLNKFIAESLKQEIQQNQKLAKHEKTSNINQVSSQPNAIESPIDRTTTQRRCDERFY
jgi:hypothetical protein